MHWFIDSTPQTLDPDVSTVFSKIEFLKGFFLTSPKTHKSLYDTVSIV